MIEILGGGGQNRVPQHDPQLEMDQEVLDKLREISPEAADAFEALQDPTLSKDDFFAAVDTAGRRFNTDLANPPEGLYSQVSRSISDKRRVKVKVFENGRIVFSGEDSSRQGDDDETFERIT